MLKAFKFMAVAVLLMVGCASWTPVPIELNPAAVKDPAKEIEAVLNLGYLPPAKVEVTDQYIKHIVIGNVGVATWLLPFERVKDIRIITRSNIYQVSAYDARGEEIWWFRPAAEDLATCQRFMNAFYAWTKRPLPTADSPAAASGKPR